MYLSRNDKRPQKCGFEEVKQLNVLTFAAISQMLVKFVEELLQRHLHFRNSLQERLSAEHWKSLVGDILVQLIGQNDVSSDRQRACVPYSTSKGWTLLERRGFLRGT